MIKTYKKTTTTDEPILRIGYDRDAQSPREWDNLGYFITVDSRYHSPDHNSELESIVKVTGYEAGNQEEHIKLITEKIETEMNEKVLAIYPVVKYEHSGVVYKLGTCHGFDYSNNGFYIVTDKSLEATEADKKDFEKIIKAELEDYNSYANGEVYEYTLYNELGEIIDSGADYYDLEDIRNNLPEEWAKVDLYKYLVSD